MSKEARFGDALLPDVSFRVVKGSAGPLEITVSSFGLGGRVDGTVTNDESLPVAGVWVVAVPEEAKVDDGQYLGRMVGNSYPIQLLLVCPPSSQRRRIMNHSYLSTTIGSTRCARRAGM